MNFYRIAFLNHDRRSTYAEGYGPLDIPMPFLTDAELCRMNDFWKVNPLAPGLIIGERGSKWPDFLPHGGSGPRYFVAERIVKSLTNEGIPMARLTEMPIAKIRSKSLRDKPAPTMNFFRIRTDGKNRSFTYAAGYGPLITPMPFLSALLCVRTSY